MRAAAARHLLPISASLSPSYYRSRHMAAADPGTAYKLLLSCPAGLPRSRVSVEFDQSFDRIPHPEAALEESISEIWDQRLQWNPSLYNGTKFRYGGHAVHYKDEPDQECRVSLHLGLTDYRTFMGTNLNPLWEKFLIPSEDYCTTKKQQRGGVSWLLCFSRRTLRATRNWNLGSPN